MHDKNASSISESFRLRSEHALKIFRQEYAEQHKTRINRQLHVAGRIIRVAAIPVVFYSWKIAVGLFVLGYLIQFLGHVIEGSSPSFFRNPKHLILGSLNHVVRLFDKNERSDAYKRT
jgi:hypothetical protein